MTGHREKLGVVLRSCEIRALVELVKFQQASLDNALIIGVDCLGTYGVTDWQAASSKQQVVDELLAGAVSGELQPFAGHAVPRRLPDVRAAAARGRARGADDWAGGRGGGQALPQGAGGCGRGAGVDGQRQAPAGREAAAKKLIAARTEARDAVFAGFRERVNSMDGLLQEFSTCIRCHNCMINCPICYCRECIFRTPTFEHESQLYYQWAERKGTVRMMPDTLLFHLTRLNHMVTSCVGCGMCADVCPVDIPVGTVFRAVGEKVQAIFDYHPGRSLDEAAPVQEFREDELTALGERPH